MKGKAKCELLKSIRKNIADMNGINYEPTPCHHDGNCPGFCPMCDHETEYLMQELKKKEAVGCPIHIDVESLEDFEELAANHSDEEPLELDDPEEELLGNMKVFPEEEKEYYDSSCIGEVPGSRWSAIMNQEFRKEVIVKRYNDGEDLEFLFFWGHTEKPGKVTKACLSQWYPCEFTMHGVTFNCAEQYMMARKALTFEDMETYEKIIAATEQSIIKQLGREVKNFKQEVWDDVKRTIVDVGNMAKFSQNEHLLDFLLSTGDKILVEASPYDTIWGIGLRASDAEAQDPNLWKGENLLGEALMETRCLLSRFNRSKRKSNEEKHNPYAVVKEDREEETDGDVKVTHITGYDIMGRIVKRATYRDFPDGTRGHSVRQVESDGYWRGGAYDPIAGGGCQFAPEKFEIEDLSYIIYK